MVEVSQANRTVTVSNLGSYPADLHGYELSWQADGEDEQREYIWLIGFQWGVTVARRSQLGFPA